jgi:hypothetical protein
MSRAEGRRVASAHNPARASDCELLRFAVVAVALAGPSPNTELLHVTAPKALTLRYPIIVKPALGEGGDPARWQVYRAQ